MRVNRIFAVAVGVTLLSVAFVAGTWSLSRPKTVPVRMFRSSRAGHDRIEGGPLGNVQIKELKRLGAEGWEAVAMNDSRVLLKRSR